MESPVDVQQLVSGAGDAIIASDLAGKIVLWNGAAERVFGFSAAEALGQSLDLIIPEPQRERHWHGYDDTMKSGKTQYGTSLLRVPALHKDGHRLSIAFPVSLLSAEGTGPVHCVAIIRDETERWTSERALRQRLRELEETLGQTETAR
ncbi:PAS domain S-box protein [Thioclava sp. BHET1]|nr:PAS domain S-box protein [Thioclava sp. BHET1]